MTDSKRYPLSDTE